MTIPHYRIVRLGKMVVARGPGLTDHGPALSLSIYAREVIAELLSRAYEAGRDAKAEEIRNALGARKR